MYDLVSLVGYYLGYTTPPEQSIQQAGPAPGDIPKEGDREEPKETPQGAAEALATGLNPACGSASFRKQNKMTTNKPRNLIS